MILLIDTSSQNATVGISENGIVKASIVDEVQTNHASFVQPAIQRLLKENNLRLTDLTAVAVVAGPGSYTGLRVGMASAKGLCYVLKVPLISISALKAIAYTIIQKDIYDESALICPMIDARRMEVFSAIYNYSLQEILTPRTIILDSNSFKTILEENKVIFSGNGAKKFTTMLQHQNIFFEDVSDITAAFSALAHHAFVLKSFTDVAYGEPEYLKETYIAGK